MSELELTWADQVAVFISAEDWIAGWRSGGPTHFIPCVVIDSTTHAEDVAEHLSLRVLSEDEIATFPEHEVVLAVDRVIAGERSERRWLARPSA